MAPTWDPVTDAGSRVRINEREERSSMIIDSSSAGRAVASEQPGLMLAVKPDSRQCSRLTELQVTCTSGLRRDSLTHWQ